jgi:ABC-type phosphate transport system permease subunit
MDKKELAVHMLIWLSMVSMVIAFTMAIEFGMAVAIGADEFSCDWVFCGFKKTIKEDSVQCTVDGVPIDCPMTYRLR